MEREGQTDPRPVPIWSHLSADDSRVVEGLGWVGLQFGLQYRLATSRWCLALLVLLVEVREGGGVLQQSDPV